METFNKSEGNVIENKIVFSFCWKSWITELHKVQNIRTIMEMTKFYLLVMLLVFNIVIICPLVIYFLRSSFIGA